MKGYQIWDYEIEAWLLFNTQGKYIGLSFEIDGEPDYKKITWEKREELFNK